VSEPQKKKELSSEMRILIASILSMVVILLWAKFFAPKPPANLPDANKPAITSPAATIPAAGSPGTASPSTTPAKPNAATPAGVATGIAPSNAAAMPPKAAEQERTIVVENGLYRVEISNRGGIVKSWQLKKYMDDSKPQRVLDVVHPQAAEQVGGWPFALVLDDQQMQTQANTALYVAGIPHLGAPQKDILGSVTNLPEGALKAPAEFQLTWSDGHLEVTKNFRFDDSYVVRVETTVKFNGSPVKAGLAWLGGFGDLTVQNPVPVETVNTFYNEGGKLTDLPYKKLEGPDKWGPGVWMGGKDYAGIEDRYFAAAFLPANGVASGSLETRYWKVMRTVQVEGKDAQEPVSEVATATSAQPMALRVYVGPKDYDDLKAMKPPLQALVNFGFLEFIAEPLFHGLKWLHKYIHGYGWAIIVLTLVINMLLFPLRISSYKTTLKMQRVAPEIKAIQERYKKYKLNDPKKQEMNKEVMAIYSREGINPVGGCFQMFLQMPIWFGLNSALRGAIELRHAQWLWISDLASKDPYYVLPVVVGVSMYLVSKMTPMTTADPQQAQMMKIMPIMFAGSFIIFPFSSGLALYILTSSLVGIVQQWYLNRTHPAPAAAKQISRSKK
jgi:YidC/Oxa1 family membrane protein insertase